MRFGATTRDPPPIEMRRQSESSQEILDLRDPALWVLVFTAISVAVTATRFAELYHYNVVDDAYISFQYAKHWALGDGLVFNQGQRVEGYTNFLWVALLTPLYWITEALAIDFTASVILLNVTIAVINLGLLYAVAQKVLSRDWIATSAVLILCGLDNAYLGYAMSGLENHLLIALALTGVHVWLSRQRHRAVVLGIVLALVTMTRPDGGLLFGAFVAAVGGGALLPDRWRRDQTRKVLLQQAATAAAVWTLVYGAYFLWRATYYGAWLPNTFYLKVGDTFAAIPRGLEYTRSFTEDRFYLPLIALAAGMWLKVPVIRWLLLYIVLHSAYVIYVGGDFYSGHRFYVVLLPFIYLLVGTGLKRLRDVVQTTRPWCWAARRTAVAATAVGLSVAALANGFYHFAVRGFERGPYTREILAWAETVDNNVRYMKWLGQVAPPGSTILLGDIGSAGFFTGLPVVDVYGITDPQVAHQAVETFGLGKPGHEKFGSRDYLLAHEPTYVKWGYVTGNLHSRGYRIFTEFPASLKVPGLWIREDRAPMGYVPGTQIHFNQKELDRWRAVGNAFLNAPTIGMPMGQQPVRGHSGSYLSSWAPRLGDHATGRIVSPAFPLKGEVMLLRVGGGRDPDRLRVSLLVDGEVVESATGHNFEVLGRREWPIEAYQGRLGVLEIVDDSMAGWGHIMVDEVVQWSAPLPDR